MIDKDLLARKILLISTDLNEIESHAEVPIKEYLEDTLLQAAMERYLERMIGRMIDINYHISTELGEAPPPDYFQSFLVLGDLDVMPVEFAREMATTAGLRNRLAHEYDRLDPEKVHEAAGRAAGDVSKYLEYIAKLL